MRNTVLESHFNVVSKPHLCPTIRKWLYTEYTIEVYVGLKPVTEDLRDYFYRETEHFDETL